MTPARDSFAESECGEPAAAGAPLALLTGQPDAAPDAAIDLAGLLRDRVRAALPDDWSGSLGLTVAASVLWSRFHKFDAADPGWPDRDRVVFSGRLGSLLHAALRELSDERAADTGFGLSSLAPPASLDVASGSRGHGLGHAAGLALAERLLTARFGRSLVDHRTWLLASDADLMGGLSHEVASMAGRLRLDRLTVLWDAPGGEDLAATETILARFAAYGWSVRRVEDPSESTIESALTLALRSQKPALIACRRIGTGMISGPVSPIDEDIAEIRAAWSAVGLRGSGARRAWLKRLARHSLRGEFERVMAGRLPDAVVDALAGLRASLAASRPAIATRAASQTVLETVVPRLPELVGGAADLGAPAGSGRSDADVGRRVRCLGDREEYGVAVAMNGLALHGGLIPYGGSLVVFTDDMRPALRMAALLRQRVIHVLTRDGCDRADDGREDGPAHQAIEHLASLRAMPNLYVFRPADAIETAECWELALHRADGPCVLALSRQPVASLRPPGPPGENRAARGGYVLADTDGPRQATLIATGPEVATAMAARELLRNEGIRVAVVSLPCWELFETLPKTERDAVLGAAPRIGIEAAGSFGWDRWLGDGVFVGFQGAGIGAFGLSGPAAPRADLAWTSLGRPTAADLVSAVRRALGGL